MRRPSYCDEKMTALPPCLLGGVAITRSVGCQSIAHGHPLLFMSRTREREGYEGAAEQTDSQQAHDWQVACDVKSDEHRCHRKAEEARRKAMMFVCLVNVQTEDALPVFNFHFI
ncbi:hypothetical protein ISCGN_001099 [Ixodes scapularis]